MNACPSLTLIRKNAFIYFTIVFRGIDESLANNIGHMVPVKTQPAQHAFSGIARMITMNRNLAVPSGSLGCRGAGSTLKVFIHPACDLNVPVHHRSRTHHHDSVDCAGCISQSRQGDGLRIGVHVGDVKRVATRIDGLLERSVYNHAPVYVLLPFNLNRTENSWN